MAEDVHACISRIFAVSVSRTACGAWSYTVDQIGGRPSIGMLSSGSACSVGLVSWYWTSIGGLFAGHSSIAEKRSLQSRSGVPLDIHILQKARLGTSNS